MGISRRKSRPVTFAGLSYRFLVKQVRIPDEPDQAELCVTVQLDEPRPGKVLQFRLPYGFPVGPPGVQAVIAQALQAGWQPSSRGSPFVLNDFRYP